jgi:diphthamide synthase (EF-2-diphthine--ammonia ligase)
VYEAKMRGFVEQARSEGVEVIGFGDLALADIRAYRERQLSGTGLGAVFPLWGRNTNELAREMIDAGIVAHLTCIDPRVVPASLAGRRFDLALLTELPDGVDPCGENGEFHTFVSDGPGFAAPIPVRGGEVVERDGFVFADLLLAE